LKYIENPDNKTKMENLVKSMQSAATRSIRELIPMTPNNSGLITLDIFNTAYQDIIIFLADRRAELHALVPGIIPTVAEIDGPIDKIISTIKEKGFAFVVQEIIRAAGRRPDELIRLNLPGFQNQNQLGEDL